MHDKEFDQFFKDRLGDHRSSVPSDMWQRITGKEDERKAFILWKWYFIVPACLLVCGLIGYLVFNPSATVPHNPGVAAPTHLAQRHAVAAPKPASSNTGTDDPIIAATETGTHYKSGTQNKFADSPRIQAAALFQAEPLPQAEPAQQAASNPHTEPNSKPQKESGLPAVPQPLAGPHLPAKSKPKETSPADRHPWYLEAYCSPDIPLTATGTFSYSAGFRVNKSIGHGFSITAGLQYSRINLHFKLDSLSALLAHNFRTIDLPLLAGYERGGGNYKIIFHAGLVYNIHTWPGNPGNTSPLSESYRGSTGISLYAGVDIITRLNDRFSLFAEPYVRRQLTNMLRYSFITQKIDIGGINFGIRYDLKK